MRLPKIDEQEGTHFTNSKNVHLAYLDGDNKAYLYVTPDLKIGIAAGFAKDNTNYGMERQTNIHQLRDVRAMLNDILAEDDARRAQEGGSHETI